MSTKSEPKPGLILEEKKAAGGRELTFHNELRDRMFKCTYGFKGGSVKPLGNAVEKDGKYTINVYPGSTEKFVVGEWTGMTKSHGSGEPDKAWKEKQANEAKGETDKDIALVKSLLAKSGEKKVTAEIIADVCSAAGVQFVDLTFPPKDSSMKPDWMKRALAFYPWKRPSLFLKGTNLTETLFVDKIEPNDIDQGALADCYLMGALASVAEFEHLVRSMFDVGQDTDLGCYRVNLCKNGWWQTVIVDDFLPCSGSKPAFARNREEPNELWVSLVEKAYAKLHGSYAAVQTGSCSRALSDLTGCPAKLFELSPDMWDTLLKNDQMEFLQVLGTPGKNLMCIPEGTATPDEQALWDKYQGVGLITEHCYSLITCMVTKNGGHKLCMIRNPWGNEKEWKGKWSDNDASWTPALKKECNFEAEDDGTFWMAWEDAQQWFNNVSVCYTYGSWDQVHAAGNYVDGAADMCLRVEVTKKRQCWFSSHQKDPRGVPPGHSDAKLEHVEMWVLRESPDGKIKAVGKRSTNSREQYADLALEPGFKYYLLAQPRDETLSKSMVYSLLIEDNESFTVDFLTAGVRYPSAERFAPADCKQTKANYQIKGQHSTMGLILNRTGKSVTFKDAKKDVDAASLQKAKSRAQQNNARKKDTPSGTPAGKVAPVRADAVTVKIRLVSGAGLVAMDSNGLSDPFCEVKLREVVNGKVGSSHPNPQKKVTRVVPETLDPKWDETFTLLVPTTDCVRISIFDKDIIGKDNMGRVDLLLPSLLPKLSTTDELVSDYPVCPIKQGDKVSGKVKVGLMLC
ncbi:Calpain-type cysteine protease DEK1 [Diplonema papillatum]|nr:Calpain-type cysteine protease DEK1 [Diplonema papillatum]